MQGQDSDRGLQRLPYRVAVLIVLSAIGTGLTVLMLEVQAGATAYLIGESHWSKAQQRAVHALYRYAADPDPAELAQARLALDVPLGDRDGRLALERAPVDMAAAYAGFTRGQIDARDLGRVTWMYRLLGQAPYFRQSVEYWRQAEVEILRLDALADELERRTALGAMRPHERRAYQQEVLAIDTRLRPISLAFSASLADGARALRRGLVVLALLVFVSLAGYALRVMRSTLRRVHETDSEFQMAFHQSAVGMARLDREGRFTQANPALAQILQMPLQQLLECRLPDVMLSEDIPVHRDGRIDWSGLLEQADRRLLGAQGRMRWVRWTASMVAGREPGQEHLFVLVEDVSDARALALEMHHQASHDDLTGLINRREIGRRLEQLLLDVQVRGGHHALCYLDLDQFKLVNDTCGHEAGDRYLCLFAATIKGCLRQLDWLGRLGGDEFAVLLHEVSLEQAEAVMARVYAVLADTAFVWGGRSFSLNCSAGLVELNSGASDVDWLLRAADSACYVAKEEGRHRVRCYRETDQTLNRRRRELDWVAQVRLAIAEGRLLLYAQRIQSLDRRDRAGLRYEVLVRLRDSDGQIYEPGAFMPAIERYGQGMLVDRYVIDAVSAELSLWPEHLQRLDLCHVNVSAQSVVDPSFLEHLEQLLDRWPMLAGKLCLEITETAVIGNMDDAQHFISVMRGRGCRIALDDFGSGLSSFAYLKRLEIDILKIDGVFIRDMADGDGELALVRSMVQVGEALGLETIAEWVDSEATMRRLAVLGVSAGQGYGLHAPCPLEDLFSLDPIQPLVAAGRPRSTIMLQ